MNDVLFEDYSDALTIDADIVEREREKSFSNYFENNSYHQNVYEAALKNHFDQLKNKWLSDTNLESNNYQATLHPAYLKILSLGEQVVPIILNDLINSKTHWFFALSSLTGVNPIQVQHAGQVNDMIGDWVNWGKQNALI